MSDVAAVSPSPAVPSASPAPEKKRSQKRHRTRQRIGVYDDREAARFDAAYARYLRSAAAEDYGGSVSAFVRYMTIGEGARQLPPPRFNPALPYEIASLLGQVMTELLRIGNNVNQIARHLNAGREALPDYVQATFGDLRDTLRAARRLMGWED